jgi:hypothetical protein
MPIPNMRLTKKCFSSTYQSKNEMMVLLEEGKKSHISIKQCQFKFGRLRLLLVLQFFQM